MTTEAAFPWRGIGSMSWSGDHGYVWIGGGPCEAVLAVGAPGLSYPPIEIQGHGHMFRLDDQGIDTSACDRTGRARFAEIGKAARVAFFAAPAAVGVHGFARLDVPFGLYTFGETDKLATLVLDNVNSPQGLAWSPDGKRLAFSGQGTGFGDGIWIVTVADGSMVQLSPVAASDLAWSPDGKTIATLHVGAAGQDRYDVDLFTVPDVVLALP